MRTATELKKRNNNIFEQFATIITIPNCPYCGNALKDSKAYYTQCPCCGAQLKYPRVSNYVRNYSIFDNGDTVSFSYIYKTFVYNKTLNVYIGKLYRYRYCFNIKTKQVYLTSIIDLNTHRKVAGLRNISYLTSPVTTNRVLTQGFYANLSTLFLKELVTLLVQKTGVQYTRSLTLSDIIKYIRGDACFGKDYTDFIYRMMVENRLTDMYTELTHLDKDLLPKNMLNIEFLKKKMLAYPKSIRRLAVKKPYIFLLEYILKDLSVDNKIKLYNSLNYDFLTPYYVPGIQDTINAIIYIKKQNKETEMTNKICKAMINALSVSSGPWGYAQHNDDILVRDTIRLISDMQLCNIDVPLKGSLQEIHDELSQFRSLVETAPTEISYTKDEENYIMSLDNTSFNIPRTTMGLTQIGKDMHICVGSYSRAALSKKTTIVYATEDNKLLCCIEISPSKEILQCKLYLNKRLPIDKQNIIKAWCQLNNIKFNHRMFDFDNLDRVKTNIYNKTNNIYEYNNCGSMNQVKKSLIEKYGPKMKKVFSVKNKVNLVPQYDMLPF